MFSSLISARYRADLETWVNPAQDTPGNRSFMTWALKVVKIGSSYAWEHAPQPWSVTIDGQTWSGNWTYDFGGIGSITVAAGERWIPHAADGTKSAWCSASVRMTDPAAGTGTPSGALELPRIPRGPRVRHGGTWRHSVAYVRHGGAWRTAIPHVRQGGTWRLGSN